MHTVFACRTVCYTRTICSLSVSADEKKIQKQYTHHSKHELVSMLLLHWMGRKSIYRNRLGQHLGLANKMWSHHLYVYGY